MIDWRRLLGGHDADRMPLMGRDSANLSRRALDIVIDGKKLTVRTLKVKVEDIDDTEPGPPTVMLAFAFCDENDETIVNVGRVPLMRAGDVLTIVDIANTLTFTVT